MELQGDAQEDKLTTTMNAGRQNRNQVANVGNGQVQQIDESHYVRDCPKPKVHDAKYFWEQMLLAMKDEAGGILNDEKNDFMLDNSYRDETLEEITTVVIMMTRIQPANDNAESKPKYDVETDNERNSWEQSASGLTTLKQSLDMEIMFKAISRYVMYTTLRTSDTICLRTRTYLMDPEMLKMTQLLLTQENEMDYKTHLCQMLQRFLELGHWNSQSRRELLLR
nr:hypothetical protein [Tanacetum cinerariifolium]